MSNDVASGTAHYMAPEQAEGRPVTPAAGEPVPPDQGVRIRFPHRRLRPLRAGDTLLGRVYLLSDDTGAMCVVTLKAAELKEETSVSAYLQPEDADRSIDVGNYRFYAGPVRDSTAGECIRWGGSVDGVSVDSPLGHCQ